MTDRNGRFPALLLTTILLVSAILLLVGAQEDTSAREESPTRAEKYYLGETFTMNFDWVPDDLWIVVFAQSQEIYQGTDIGDGSKFYDYREIGNSFMFPVDGNTHNSGNVRRPLVELFTATDCTYCPSAEESLDVILQDRTEDDFSLIEWHRGLGEGTDPYETGGSDKRFDSYNVTGTPTVVFDGQLGRSGGDSSVNSPMLVNAYNNLIDRQTQYDPYMILAGSASTNAGKLSFNVSFEVIDALPRGTWTLFAVVVEDLNKEHNSATMRHTQRKSFTRGFPLLQADHPDISIDEDNTYDGFDPKKAMGNIDLLWDAIDPQDGTNLDIDIIYSVPGGSWMTLAEGLPNTGSYTWDTETVEDGKYLVRVIAEDSEGNRVMSASRFVITVNNPDFPEFELTYPKEGDSLRDSAELRWNSSDDEDIMTDLLMKISLRDSPTGDWEPITFNQITFDDFIPNSGSYNFNTRVWSDLDTYQLKFELKDRDDMITELISDVFEIYNNDQPRATLFGPVEDEIVAGELVVSWKVEDEEDEAWGLVDQMLANFSVRKEGEEDWLILFLDNVDEEMEDKTFPTSALMGDGDYTLRFTVTDSRGKKHFVDRPFVVYDPDAPQFVGVVEGPADTSDLKVDTIGISWNAMDPDSDEILTYRVEISPVEIDNWTIIAEDVTDTSYDLDLTQLEQGRYKLRITAIDDSSDQLSASIEYGPFYYNAPDAPELNWIYPEPGFNGIIEDSLGIANDTGVFNIGLIWTGSDPDGDNVTYSVFWKMETDTDWKLLDNDLNLTLLDWNVTTFSDGNYMLRIVAKDASSRHLTTERILGPFSIDIPWDPPFGDDDDTGDDDIQSSDDDIDLGAIIGIAIGSVVVVILLVVVILVVLSKTTGKKPDETPVIPTSADVDLSIPEFQRASITPQPIYGGQMAPIDPYAGVQQRTETVQQQPMPAEQPAGQVSWEEEQLAPVAEQPVQDPQDKLVDMLDQPEATPQEPAPMAPPPAVPELPQGPPPMPPME